MKSVLVAVIATALVLGPATPGPKDPPFPTVRPEDVYAAQPVGILTVRHLSAGTLQLPNGKSYTLQLLDPGVAVWENRKFKGYVPASAFISPDEARQKQPTDAPVKRVNRMLIVFVTPGQDSTSAFVTIGIVFPSLYIPASPES